MAPTSSSNASSSNGQTNKKKRSKKKNKGNQAQTSFEHTAEEKSSKDTRNTLAGSGKATSDSSFSKQQKQKPQYAQDEEEENQSMNYLKDSPLLVMPPDDAIEDTSFDDPYVYSDDSGSLSDAYFFPDHDSIHAKYSENDYDHDQTQPFSLWARSNNRHNNYGSTTAAADPRSPSPLAGPMVPSRITLNGILEDSPLHEVTPLVPITSSKNMNSSSNKPTTGAATTSKPHSTRNIRKQQHQQRRAHMIRRKQRQEQRERAVKQIRGKPQTPTTCHDVVWLLLFVLQLLFVVACAIRYGWTLVRLQPPPPTTLETVGSGSSQIIATTTSSSLRIGGGGGGGLSSINNGDDHHRRRRRHLVTKILPMGARNDINNDHKSLRRELGANSSSTTMTNPITFNTTTTTTSIKTHTKSDIDSLKDDDNFEPADPNESSTSSITSSSSSTVTTKTVITSKTAQSSTSSSNNNNNDGSKNGQTAEIPFSIDYQNVIKLFSISGIYALFISYLSLGVMLIVARALIPLMLVFSILLAVCWGVFGLTLDPYSMISILGFVFLIASLGYALVCWNRIGFCSTNLYTAICAMRDTPGILFVGIGSLWIAVAWCWIWSVALMGILNMHNAADCEHYKDCGTHVPLWRTDVVVETIVLILSFYWTLMVIKNVVRVTVAGAIGAWWFATPRQAQCCCDNTVWGPLSRACSNSLGSVCLGSLIVLPAQTISVLGNVCCWMVGGGGNSQENNLVIVPPQKQQSTEMVASSSDYHDDEDAFAQECSGWMDRLWRQVRCCNRWAFTYIGMYGYSFSQGGEKAIQLFETREWMDIVRDNLIQNILLMASILIGGLTGIFAVLVEEMDGYMFTSLHEPIMISFWIGSILGFVLSNILLLGVVGAAVNTILVCFAADPFEFDKNHPLLSREMREVWSQQVWEPSVENV